MDKTFYLTWLLLSLALILIILGLAFRFVEKKEGPVKKTPLILIAIGNILLFAFFAIKLLS